jgi:hypothetical protein
MGNTFTCRDALLGFAASASTLVAAAAPATIESHVHVFDPGRVPYAPDAPYKPAACTLEAGRGRRRGALDYRSSGALPGRPPLAGVLLRP